MRSVAQHFCVLCLLGYIATFSIDLTVYGSDDFKKVKKVF